METRQLILMQGIQASGKSTWSRNWVLEDPEHRLRFSNDDIRNMYGKYWILSREHMVKNALRNFVGHAIISGYDIVIDNMNLNPKELDFYKNIIEEYSLDTKYKYILSLHQCFNVSLETCIARDASRKNPIGEKVIRDTFKKYRQYIATELDKQEISKWKPLNNNLSKAIIVDLDATLAFNTQGRPFWGSGCAEGICKDSLDFRMQELIHSICNNGECAFIALTGREDLPEIRKATLDWLDTNWLYPTELIMRPKGDFSKGDECKLNLYNKFITDKYNIIAVIEDSQKCVDMWRSLGLLCLQPNSGLL